MSFSLLFLMLATEKMKRYLYVSTHFRSSSIRFCFSSKPFLAVFVKETFLSRLDFGIAPKTRAAEDQTGRQDPGGAGPSGKVLGAAPRVCLT